VVADDLAAPPLAAALVCDHTPRNAEQPRSHLVALRAPVEAPPQRGEGLGDRLRRIFGIADTPKHVAADRPIRLAIDRLETLAALVDPHRHLVILVSSVFTHNRNMSGSARSVSV
jgi:hypothetical protein